MRRSYVVNFNLPRNLAHFRKFLAHLPNFHLATLLAVHVIIVEGHSLVEFLKLIFEGSLSFAAANRVCHAGPRIVLVCLSD